MSEHIFTLKGRQKRYKNLKTMNKLLGCQVISYTYFKKEKLYHIDFQKNYHISHKFLVVRSILLIYIN